MSNPTITSDERSPGPLIILHRCILLGLLAVTLGMLAGRWWWPFDLLTHFRVQCAVVALVLCLWATLQRHKRAGLVSVVMLAFLLIEIVPLYLPETLHTSQASQQSNQELVVVSMNLFSGNRDIEAVTAYLESHDADIVAVQELSLWWEHQLKLLSQEYPHQQLIAREGNFGIGLLSRFPLSDVETHWLSENNPAITATVDVNGASLTVIVAHPFPPMGREATDLRNRQFLRLAEVVNERSGSCIVVGDFNTTSWSTSFTDLIGATRLRDSRNGFGIQPTWPVGRTILRIPIDHALVSDDIDVLSRTVGPDVGSDHFPIELRLRIANRTR